jgi:hypothetical protein
MPIWMHIINSLIGAIIANVIWPVENIYKIIFGSMFISVVICIIELLILERM